MKNILRALVAPFLLIALVGCAPVTFGTIGKVTEFATVGVANPVPYEALAGAEAAVTTARSGAIAYLGLPICRYGTAAMISNVCSKPAIRREIKFYNRKVQVSISKARQFVRANSVNASDVIALVYQSISELNAVKARNGIPN